MPAETRHLGSRYELIKPLGSGVMGEVWAARDLETGTLLAAKLLHPQWAQNPEIVARFVQERSVLLALRHPAIVRVVDLVAEGSVLAIVMEYVPGGTLAEFLHRWGTLTPSVAVPLACAVLDGLAYAHAHGVLHRDVKPDNVLLTSSDNPGSADVRLGDFGIARLSDDATVQVTGLLGTPAYMPPELFSAGSFSAASDVYACGVLLYELLAGRTPFAGDGTALTVGLRHVTMIAPRPEGLDPRLWQIIADMLAKDPHDRLPADRVAQALRGLPDDALAGPALPMQPQPLSWQTLPTAEQDIFGQAIHVQVASGDIGATMLATPPPATHTPVPAAQPGTARALAALDAAVDDQQTMLATPVARPARPQLASQVAAPVPAQRPRWLLPVVSAAVVVVVVAVVLLVTMVHPGFGSRAAAPAHPAWTPAHAEAPDYPTGLDESFDATGANGGIGLTVTLRAPRSTGLSGNVLIAFPSTGATCPGVTATGVTLTGLTASHDGVTTPCSYGLPVTLTAGQSQAVQLQITGANPSSLDTWLSDLQSTTATALGQITGDAFALQRIQGIQVQVGAVQLTGATTPVLYSVVPTWPGAAGSSPSPSADSGTAGSSDILLRNDTLDYQATDLLLSLTDGAGLSDVTVRACPQVLVTGNHTVAQQPTPTCFLQVTIGELDSGQTTFPITMQPS